MPSVGVAVALVASLSMGGSDRALMLAVPGVAVLAAFALPTLKRSAGSAIDWFSVFFFTALAIAIWVFYVGMMTGTPAKPAQRIAALLPGFEAHFSPALLVLAIAGHRGLAGAGALAHGARAARAVEVAGAAGLGRGT